MRISDWSADVCSSDLPTAERKPDQKDEDSLPPYPVLDDILKGLIEGEESVDIIVARGHDRDLLNRVWRMLDLAEYTRRPASPGVKITRRALGRNRRHTIPSALRCPARAGSARRLATEHSSGRERGCPYVEHSEVAETNK